MLPVSYATRHMHGTSLMETYRRGKSPDLRGRVASCTISSFAALGVVLLIFEVWKLSTSSNIDLSGVTSTHLPGSSRLSVVANQHRSQHSSRRQLDLGGSTLRRRFPAAHLHTLVLVACHSVYTGLDFTHPEDQSSWYLLDYQKVPGQVHSFVEHIKLGVAQAAADPQAMLLFSGGKTRRDAGPRAEAMGYWLVAEANSWFGHAAAVRDRAYTEEHARDSFENFMFGLCRFYELTGHYPSSIVVVGYEFKRLRFGELHRAALRWPPKSFNYVGTPALTEGAEAGEETTAAAFEKDPYGCAGELAEKRAKRDPFADGGYAGERCPAMASLLKHCGPGIFDGPLAWDTSNP